MLSVSELSYFTECLIFISGFSLGIILIGFGVMDERFKKMKLIKRIPLLLLIWLGWHIILPVPTYFLAYGLQIIIKIF